MMVKTDIDFEQLHDDIEAGRSKAPAWWSKQFWTYRRWRQSTVAADRLQRRQGGASPVRFETTFGLMKPRGFTGRTSGYAAVQSGPREWQTTTNLGCGFNPNVVGASAPAIGTPLGRHVTTGAEVACDLFAWFVEGVIANPSLFLLSLPGLGKSTLIRKMLMGSVAKKHIPIIAGDIKAEYVGFVEQVGGQVIRVGHGVGHINPLDVGALGRVIPQLEAQREALAASGKEDLIERAREQVHGRQVTMVTTLVSLGRGAPVHDFEAMLISMALREIYDQDNIDWEHPPVLQDLIDHLESGSTQLLKKGRAEDKAQWNQRIDELILSLNALLDGATGKIFSGQTTTPIKIDAPAVCIDVSAIGRGDSAMKAAVMMACWSAAFGAVEAAHLLSDAGLAPQQFFAVTLDEMWQVLASAPGMVSQVDALTRLNRTDALALMMITHTFKDLEALPTEEDRKTAMGFIERAGLVICGGLPASELDILSSRLSFSAAEAQMVTSWSKGAPPRRARTRGSKAIPPGRGRFMIKPSKDGAPGIPVQTILFPSEQQLRLHDTNVRFAEMFAEAGEG